MADSPSSPDPENGEEHWSISSDSEAEVGPYQPIVSPVTPDVNEATGSEMNKAMGTSKAQNFWANSCGPMRGGRSRAARRIAYIQPMQTRNGRTVTARPRAAEFRLAIQTPVLQTRSIISRVSMRDGSIVEEALHDRFVMARTVATQTAPVRGRDMATATDQGEGEACEVRGVEDAVSVSEGSSAGTPLQDENPE
jgi:hypothetical protein